MKGWIYDTISLKEPTDLDAVDLTLGVNDDAIIRVDARQVQEAVLTLGGKIVCTIINIDKLYEARRKARG